jgi:Uma2 family endonuclease
MVQEIKPQESATPVQVKPPLKMTYEEFLQWADEEQHCEWVNGEVIFMGTVSREHNAIGHFLIAILSIWIESKNLGVLCSDPFNMKTAPHLNGRSPDILFVANEHLARLKKNHLAGPADLVVEIISPESRARARGDKYYEYEEGGVPEYWLLDPLRKKTEFYHLGADGKYEVMPVDENGNFHSRVFDGLWLKVEWLWQDPKPSILNVVKEWGLV